MPPWQLLLLLVHHLHVNSFLIKRSFILQNTETEYFNSEKDLFGLSCAENQKGQLEKSCSHHSISLNLTRSPVNKEDTYDVETSSTAWNKAVGRKEACHGEGNKEKKTDRIGSPSKGETIPEVEALLARLRAL